MLWYAYGDKCTATDPFAICLCKGNIERGMESLWKNTN
jgi:hypothetical protein